MKAYWKTRAASRLAGLLFPAAAALLFTLLTLFAGDAADAARDGLDLSLRVAVPALFPFFVAGALLTGSGLVDSLGRMLTKPMHALYGLGGSGAVALVLGLTGGYPVGAQAVCDLYRAQTISRTEAERLIGFCNNTGPAFIIGFAGVAVCGSTRAGMCLYLIHVLAALITGIAMTPAPGSAPLPPFAAPRQTARNPAAIFLCAVRESFMTCLTITAFITFFSVLLALLRRTGLLALFGAAGAPILSALGLPRCAADAAAAGFLELTNGLALLPTLGLNYRQMLPLAAFLLGFGGLSVHCQTLSILQQAGLSAHRHFAGKTLHGAISAALAVIWCRISPLTVPVFVSGSHPAAAPAASLLGYGVLAAVVFAIITRSGGKNAAFRYRPRTRQARGNAAAPVPAKKPLHKTH